MKTSFKKKTLSFILCMVLTVAMALSTTGCNGSNNNNTPSTSAADTDSTADATVLGEGSTSFAFSVTGTDGSMTQFEIHTDKATVGEALLELDLIAGDDSEYGLYVKTVDGITLDYDKDGKYWAFYIDGEYATSGVDSTQITAGASYAFKAE